MQADKSRAETILKAMIGKGWLMAKDISKLIDLEHVSNQMISQCLREYMLKKKKKIFLYKQINYNKNVIWFASYVEQNIKSIEEVRGMAEAKKKLISETFLDKGWFLPADFSDRLEIPLQKFGIYLHQMQEKEYNGLAIESREVKAKPGRTREWKISTNSELTLDKKFTQLLRRSWL